MINIADFLLFSIPLFFIGLLMAMVKKNLIQILIGIELMVNASLLNLIAFATLDKDRSGTLFFMFLLVLGAISMGLGLAIIIKLYKQIGSIQSDKITSLKK